MAARISMHMPDYAEEEEGDRSRAPPCDLMTIYHTAMRRASGSSSRVSPQNVIRKLACNVRAVETMPD